VSRLKLASSFRDELLSGPSGSATAGAGGFARHPSQPWLRTPRSFRPPELDRSHSNRGLMDAPRRSFRGVRSGRAGRGLAASHPQRRLLLAAQPRLGAHLAAALFPLLSAAQSFMLLRGVPMPSLGSNHSPAAPRTTRPPAPRPLPWGPRGRAGGAPHSRSAPTSYTRSAPRAPPPRRSQSTAVRPAPGSVSSLSSGGTPDQADRPLQRPVRHTASSYARCFTGRPPRATKPPGRWPVALGGRGNRVFQALSPLAPPAGRRAPFPRGHESVTRSPRQSVTGRSFGPGSSTPTHLHCLHTAPTDSLPFAALRNGPTSASAAGALRRELRTLHDRRARAGPGAGKVLGVIQVINKLAASASSSASGAPDPRRRPRARSERPRCGGPPRRRAGPAAGGRQQRWGAPPGRHPLGRGRGALCVAASAAHGHGAHALLRRAPPSTPVATQGGRHFIRDADPAPSKGIATAGRAARPARSRRRATCPGRTAAACSSNRAREGTRPRCRRRQRRSKPSGEAAAAAAAEAQPPQAMFASFLSPRGGPKVPSPQGSPGQGLAGLLSPPRLGGPHVFVQSSPPRLRRCASGDAAAAAPPAPPASSQKPSAASKARPSPSCLLGTAATGRATLTGRSSSQASSESQQSAPGPAPAAPSPDARAPFGSIGRPAGRRPLRS